MVYPRIVEIENPKLLGLLKEKDVLITQGRETSQWIEKIEIEMENVDAEIQEIEKSVDISDINKEADSITEEMNAILVRMEEIKTRIYARMKESVPPALGEKYNELKVKKESLETERNKIALKAQQKTDKIIPLARKAMSPYLEQEYDDYEGIRIENGKLIATIFNHLTDWKSRQNNK